MASAFCGKCGTPRTWPGGRGARLRDFRCLDCGGELVGASAWYERKKRQRARDIESALRRALGLLESLQGEAFWDEREMEETVKQGREALERKA